jgi:hypothetical protein
MKRVLLVVAGTFAAVVVTFALGFAWAAGNVAGRDFVSYEAWAYHYATEGGWGRSVDPGWEPPK